MVFISTSFNRNDHTPFRIGRVGVRQPDDDITGIRIDISILLRYNRGARWLFHLRRDTIISRIQKERILVKSQAELFRLYREMTGKTTYVPKGEPDDIYGYQIPLMVTYYGVRAE